jgi:hypothetical protein
MSPMRRDECSQNYDIKQPEYLVRHKGKLEIKRHVPKSQVIDKALSLNLDQAAVDDFFAQPDIQDKIKDKAWYMGRVVATNIPTAGNNSTTTNDPTITNDFIAGNNPITANNLTTANNPTTANLANEEVESFNLAEAHAAGYMLDVEEAV